MMKRLLFLIVFLAFAFCASAQGPFTGFFRPSSELDVKGLSFRADGDASHEFYFRPAAQLTAFQFTYNKDLKQFESSAFSSMGIGLGLQHYVEHQGQIINNYGFNALIIFDGSQSSNGAFGALLTVNALQFVNIGAGYNLTDKQIFLLTGAIYTF